VQVLLCERSRHKCRATITATQIVVAGMDVLERKHKALLARIDRDPVTGPLKVPKRVPVARNT